MKKIVYVVNTIEFFNSHRLPIADEAFNQGYNIHILANMKAPGGMKRAGFTYHHVGFSRSGQNIFYELFTFLRLIVLFYKIKPDLVHLVTIKPVLYGGLAARIVGIKAVVAAISGLGSVFSASKGLSLMRMRFVNLFYRIALMHDNPVVIFQNEDDRQKLLLAGAVGKEKTRLIRGSGVSLSDYPVLPEPEGIIIVSMAARLLKEKGVREFVDAARILKLRNIPVTMQVIGSPDLGNPSSVTQEEISKWEEESIAHFLGYRTDIASLYSRSNIVCLPSYYGEGLPKSLVEAAACGRAVITTDMPGCRDAIVPGKTGILVPVKDSLILADRIEALIKDSFARRQMGKAGRKLAEEAFTIEQIVQEHMDIYQELLVCA